jgi:DNA-binding transcriptional ArsR family regulator
MSENQFGVDAGAAGVAAAIGEPSRARMLYCLLDGNPRSSTELAIVGEVSPSTASAHLARLIERRLVSMTSQPPARAMRDPRPPRPRICASRAPATTTWRGTRQCCCASG